VKLVSLANQPTTHMLQYWHF